MNRSNCDSFALLSLSFPLLYLTLAFSVFLTHTHTHTSGTPSSLAREEFSEVETHNRKAD